MYLSSLVLNPQSREARRDLADLQQIHRRVMSGFPDRSEQSARAALGVLFRAELGHGMPTILVQSQDRPDWDLPFGYLASEPRIKPIAGVMQSLQQGARYRFRLLANPTKKVPRIRDGKKLSQGQRVELYRETEQAEWLHRKGERHGFSVAKLRADGPQDRGEDLTIRQIPRRHGSRRHSGVITAAGALFEGHLIVTDNENFVEAIENGIGPGKAYGFGLMSLAPPL